MSSLLIAAMAGPVAAVDQSVGVITGAVAELGDSFGGWSCTKENHPGPVGRAIGLPIVAPKAADLDYKYRLKIPGNLPGVMPETFTALIEDNQYNGDFSVAMGQLRICGNIGPVGGQQSFPVELGPWCGMSKGYNGIGTIKFTDLDDSEVRWAQVSDVAWKLDTGVTSMLGKVRAQTTAGDGTSKGIKEQKWGTLIVLASLRSLPGEVPPDQSCISALNGGRQLRVDAVAAIVDPDNDGAKNDVLTWHDNRDGDEDRHDSPIFCKGSRDSDDDGVKDEKCPIYQAKTKGTKPKDNG